MLLYVKLLWTSCYAMLWAPVETGPQECRTTVQISNYISHCSLWPTLIRAKVNITKMPVIIMSNRYTALYIMTTLLFMKTSLPGTHHGSLKLLESNIWRNGGNVVFVTILKGVNARYKTLKIAWRKLRNVSKLWKYRKLLIVVYKWLSCKW